MDRHPPDGLEGLRGSSLVSVVLPDGGVGVGSGLQVLSIRALVICSAASVSGIGVRDVSAMMITLQGYDKPYHTARIPLYRYTHDVVIL